MDQFGFLSQLEAIIDARINAPTPDSYTARLAEAGIKRVAQKVGEEGVEVALAAVDEPSATVTAESADLLYHLLVLLKLREISLADVVADLEARHRP